MRYTDFAKQCVENGIGLDGQLMPSSMAHLTDTYQLIWHVAAGRAGRQIRDHPDEVLLDVPLGEDFAFDETSIAQVAFKNILNCSLFPTTPHYEGRAFSSYSAPIMPACTCAEAGFSTVFSAMTRPGVRSTRGEPVGWTIMESAGKAIGVTKRIGYGIQSTIALDTLNVNGIPFPAGSLYSVKAQGQSERQEKLRTVLPSSAVGSIAFLRFTAYIEQPNIRREEFGSTLEAADSYSEPLTHWTLEEIRDVAQQAMNLSECA